MVIILLNIQESSEFVSSGIPFIRANNLLNKTISPQEMYFITPEKHQTLLKGHIKRGDVLITTRGDLGKTALVPESYNDANINAQLVLLRANPQQIDPKFLIWCFDTVEVKFQITQLQTGTALQQLPVGKLRKIEIPVPPLEEQRRIAEVLERAEELRSKRREAIAQLDTLTQAIFLEMFGDPLINPNNFPIQKLGELCSHIIDCPHSTPTYATKITPYACVRSSDIQNNELIFSDVKYLELEEYKKRIKRGVPQPGDVIYCREGARFGNAALVTDDTPLICLGQRMMLFRPEPSTANGEFIWGYLSNPIAYHQALREVGGSASPHINIRDITAFQIPVPPISRQREFAQRISAVNKLKATHSASMSELDALFASLQHRAFRGEL